MQTKLEVGSINRLLPEQRVVLTIMLNRSRLARGKNCEGIILANLSSNRWNIFDLYNAGERSDLLEI